MSSEEKEENIMSEEVKQCPVRRVRIRLHILSGEGEQ